VKPNLVTEHGVEPVDRYPDETLSWFHDTSQLVPDETLTDTNIQGSSNKNSTIMAFATNPVPAVEPHHHHHHHHLVAGPSYQHLLAAHQQPQPVPAAPGRRSLSVSESGVDSGCASDSGGGSTVSQTSLPTATPPPSPGFAMAIAATSATGSAATHGVVLDPYSKRRRATDAAGFGAGGAIDRRLVAAVVAKNNAAAAAAAVAAQVQPVATGGGSAIGSGAGEMARSRSHESDLQVQIEQFALQILQLQPNFEVLEGNVTRIGGTRKGQRTE